MRVQSKYIATYVKEFEVPDKLSRIEIEDFLYDEWQKLFDVNLEGDSFEEAEIEFDVI